MPLDGNYFVLGRDLIREEGNNKTEDSTPWTISSSGYRHNHSSIGNHFSRRSRIGFENSPTQNNRRFRYYLKYLCQNNCLIPNKEKRVRPKSGWLNMEKPGAVRVLDLGIVGP
jgi:hypothetical protein